jgi:hypothetical protein
MPKYIASGFSSQFRLDELEAFFKKYPEAGAGNYRYINYIQGEHSNFERYVPIKNNFFCDRTILKN